MDGGETTQLRPSAAAGNGAAAPLPEPDGTQPAAGSPAGPSAPAGAPAAGRPAEQAPLRTHASPGGAALFEPPTPAAGPADESPTVRAPRGSAAADPTPVRNPATDQPPFAATDRGADRPAAERPNPARPNAERPNPARPTTDRPAGARPADPGPADDSPTVAVRAPAAGRPADQRPGSDEDAQATTALRRPGSAAPEAAGARTVNAMPARSAPVGAGQNIDRQGVDGSSIDGPTQRLRRPEPTEIAGAAAAADEERTTVAPATDRPTVFAPVGSPAGGGSPTTDLPGGLPNGLPGGLPGGLQSGPDDDEPFGRGPGGTAEQPRRKRRVLLLVAAVVGVLAALYVGDLVLSSGSVPRGTSMAGLELGGLSLSDAEGQLRTQIEPRTTQPIAVTLGDATADIDPATAGLAVDWAATLDRIDSQPLNPITRVTSFFTATDVDVATTADQDALTAALGELSPIMDKEPVEGGVRFEGTTPVPVQPVPGQHLDVPAATEVLKSDWVLPGPVALPLVVQNPLTTSADVDRAIAEVAEPAVSAPVSVLGEAGTTGTLTPEVIASALTFRGEPGGLVPELNKEVLVEKLTPQLAASETPGRDASLDFTTGKPVVKPSQDGRGVDYEATLAGLLPVLTGTGEREITAVYGDKPAELTTDKLNSLGITGVIGEFQTGGFAQDSGRNIKRAAEVINGMVVQPGETFSLNAATTPRDATNGYVEAGIIDNGRAGRGVGGGVSQVATTLYNAAYFAGMVDVSHKEHSFYISRYPAGREATVFEGSIDMKFRNDNPTGVLIQTEWTPTTLTVRLYGTKRYEVTSSPGPRTNPTTPNTVTIPAGERCVASNGAPGFTITDTRTLKEITTGEVRTENRTVRYNPVPIVVCGG